jgi:hypothetical protein
MLHILTSKVTLVLILILSMFAGIYYELSIKRYFPAFSAVLFVSGVVCFSGLVYAMVMRNILIAVLIIIGTAAVPWLFNWFAAYWPYISDRFMF